MIPERLTALREEMKRRSIDIYVVPTADFHESEMLGSILRRESLLQDLPVPQERQSSR